MVRLRAELGSLRFSRLEKERLLLALLFSLLAHLGVWGGYEAGKKTGLWNRLPWHRPQAQVVQPKPPMDTAQPTIFVDVSEPDVEPPKEAKYYSDKNSRAANPTAEVDSNVPKIIGTQKEVVKIEDTPRPVKAQNTQPTAPQPEKESKSQQARHPQPLVPGNSEKSKPMETADANSEPETAKRPRTLQEARQMQQNKIAGMQMQQEGGVSRHRAKVSFDAISTPFGAYDGDMIRAIQQRWYDLLDKQHYAYDRIGKVTVAFRLLPDGTVTETEITRNTVGDMWSYVCVNAIQESAPFGKWPSDMRRMVGANFRDVSITFIYSPD